MRVIGSHDFYDPDDFKWELYNINEDFSQANNLADKNPDKLRELQDAFDVEAKKYSVYPLDSSFASRADPAIRSSLTRGCSEFVYFPGLMKMRRLVSSPRLEPRGAQIRLTGALAVGLLAGRNGPLV
jgi:hypothetical protein